MQKISIVMSVHTIRLAGPWELQTSSDATVERVTLPHRISSGEELRRKFHCPSGLTNDSTVRIVLTSTGSDIQLQLNGRNAPPVANADGQFDVSGLLQPFNALTASSSKTATLTTAVLEIHE